MIALCCYDNKISDLNSQRVLAQCLFRPMTRLVIDKLIWPLSKAIVRAEEINNKARHSPPNTSAQDKLATGLMFLHDEI